MSSIQMSNLLTPERVILNLRAENKFGVIDKLSRVAAATIGLSEELVRQIVLAQDDLATFGVGGGIALPHASLPVIPEPIGFFAKLNRPISFGAADGRPADLVLLILAPDRRSDVLLRALSCAARRLRDREVLKRLRTQINQDAAHLVLTSDSWRGNEPRSDWKRTAGAAQCRI